MLYPPSGIAPYLLGLLSSVLVVACSPPAASRGETVQVNPSFDISPLNGKQRSKELSRESVSQALDELLHNRISAREPGVAVLVTHNHQTLYAKGQGMRNVEQNLPITAQTVFDLASVSKQMTGLAILLLQEQGDLDLDAPVTNYLPEFDEPEPDAPIRVSDLLHHTSGLDDYTGSNWEGNASAFANLTLETHLDWLNGQDSINEAGVEFEYNNSGYGLLALIVERVSGLSFPDFMAQRVFAPAGMNQSQVYRELGQTFPQQAQGYVVVEGEAEPVAEPSLMVGDGNVFASIADLARYDQALRQGPWVSEATRRLMFRNGMVKGNQPIQDEGEGYGAGWSLTQDYAHHSGSWTGTSTYYRFYTQLPISIVVLSNNEDFDSQAFGEDIAQVLGLE